MREKPLEGPPEKNTGYCGSHPSVKTNWRCTECGKEFCENCVTPHHHAMSYLIRSASCPACKGRCIDFQHIDKLARKRMDEIKKRRRTVIKLLGVAGVVLLLFVLLFGIAPFELVIPVLLTMAVLTWALGFQGLLDRWSGSDSVFSSADDYIDTDSLIRRKRMVFKIAIILFILAVLFFYYQEIKYFPNSNLNFFRLFKH